MNEPVLSKDNPVAMETTPPLVNNSTPPTTKQRPKKGSSASSHGSSGRSANNRDGRRLGSTSSSSCHSDDERIATTTKRRMRKPRRAAFSADDEDDERTDSADEGGVVDNNHKTHNSGVSTIATSSSYYNQYNASGFHQPLLKPLSPTNLHVGYGSELLSSRVPLPPPPTTDISNALDSPHPSETGRLSSDTLSPEAPPEQEPPSRNSSRNGSRISLPTLSNPVTIATANAANPVLPSPSLAPSTTNTALPFAGWGWSTPAAAAIYSPFCANSNSVATTPAVTDNLNPFLPPGPSTYLQAVICHESEGVLVVNVRWRNKTFSGSLIDLQHHQWAPPRLSVCDTSVELKDIFVKQDLERESVDVVAVMEEQSKEDSIEQEKEDMVVGGVSVEPPAKDQLTNETTSRYSDISDNSDSENKMADGGHISKTPIQQQQVVIVGGGEVSKLEEKQTKISPSSLPPFDSVKSPQPQLVGREEKESAGKPGKPSPSKEGTPPPTQQTNHGVLYNNSTGAASTNKIHNENFNTLVDVAAAMKPVTNESTSLTESNKESVPPKSTLTYLPSEEDGRHGNGNDSDSSGSGSLSPVKKKPRPLRHHTHQHDKNVVKGGGGAPAPPTTSVEPLPSLPPMNKTIVGGDETKQPDTPAFGSMQFPFYMIPPISPGETEEQERSGGGDSIGSINQTPALSKIKQWPPPTHQNAPQPHPMIKELDARFPPNMETSNPAHLVVPSLVGFTTNSDAIANSAHGTPPSSGSTHSSVIQDKGKIHLSSSGRKRKHPPPPLNDSNKRSTTPPKEMDSMRKPLPPLPQSLSRPGGVGGRVDVIMHPPNMESNSLDGFVYDPSLPMSKEYQMIAYQREKAAEEKHEESNNKKMSPKIKRSRIEQQQMDSHAIPTSVFAAAAARGVGPPTFMPPGVLNTEHIVAHHHGLIPPTQIKQEPMSRPSRPSSKGSSHHAHVKQQVAPPPSNQSKKYNSVPSSSGTPSSSRQKHEIKVEQPEQFQWVPPTHFVPGIINIPGITMASSPPNSQTTLTVPQYLPTAGVHFLPPPMPPGGGGKPPPMVKTEPSHSGSAHSVRSDITRQTPSPNPKKSHDWTHPRPHVITPTPTKAEHGHHSNHLPNDSKHHGSTSGHVRMPHQSRHSIKHETSSSSRHTPSSHPQPSPTPTSLRNGITPVISSNEDLIKMQMLQLEALQKSAIPAQDVVAWQTRLAMEQTLQLQLAQQQMAAVAAAQQQQQQQQNDAMVANFQAHLAAAQGLPAGIIPTYMQPLTGFPSLTPGVVTPYTLHPQKRDS